MDEREAARKLSADEFVRRRRGRNYALLFVLLALCALFYAITIAQWGLK
jgi:peptidoglycan/LPS O-acetylase OafA/YrhL